MPTVQKPIAKSAPRPAGKPIAKTVSNIGRPARPTAKAHTDECIDAMLIATAPLCKNCRYYSSYAGRQSCSSPRNGFSLVTGRPHVLNPEACRSPATDRRQCGRLGANFVAKPVQVKRAWWKF